MAYTFRLGADGARLENALLRNIDAPSGLTPLFGIEQRPQALMERLLAERKVAGERLQNISALLACIEASYDMYARGELTKERLIGDVWETLDVLHSQTAYDEAELLMR